MKLKWKDFLLNIDAHIMFSSSLLLPSFFLRVIFEKSSVFAILNKSIFYYWLFILFLHGIRSIKNVYKRRKYR